MYAPGFQLLSAISEDFDKLKRIFCSFISKLPRPEDSEVTFVVFESSCHLLLPVEPLKGRGNLVKCIAYKGHNELILRPYLHTVPFFMLNVKQGSCEYQLLKSFGLIWLATRQLK